MDDEQEVGSEDDDVWVRSVDERGVGDVQKDGEGRIEDDSGASGTDGRCGSEEEMGREDGAVEGDDSDITRDMDLPRR